MTRLPLFSLAASLALLAIACGSSDGSNAADVPEAVADVPADAPADASADVPPDLPADVPAELPADVPADVPTDVPPADVPPDVPADVPADTPPDDAPGETTGPEPDPVWGFAGTIRLEQYMSYANGAVPQSSAVQILLDDAPNGRAHVIEAEAGACRFYRAPPPWTCTPACADDWTEYCSIDGVCLPYPQRVSAGTITLAGLQGGPYVIPVGDADWYSAPETPPTLFEPGAAITVSASGGDVPPFEAHLTGVDLMKTPIDGALTLVDGADQAVTWTPAGDGSTVELVLQIGWHGRPPEAIIWCTAPDADGSVTVPQAMIEAFPYFGGMGLFQHPCLLRRVSRAVVLGKGGPIEVLAASVMGFGVIH